MPFSKYRWYEPLPVVGQFNSQSRKRLFIVGFSSFALILLFLFFIRNNVKNKQFHPLDNFESLNSLPILSDISNLNLPPIKNRAVVSSLYSDSFVIAVAVLGHSSRSANVSAQYILPFLQDRISSRALCIAKAVGWDPIPVPFIPPPHNGRGVHPRFHDQYTKLNIWSLDTRDIHSLVYLDADTLVRRDFSELFGGPFGFAAVQDVYGPDDPRGFSVTFNAGVLALRPSSAVFEDMKSKIETATFPLKQAEQAFLNLYYAGKGLRLPYVYNANLAIKRRSSALWEAMEHEMRVVHYTSVKPFLDDTRPADAILTPEEQRETMARAAAREDGFYADEIAWWKDAYERMQSDKGSEIAACLRH